MHRYSITFSTRVPGVPMANWNSCRKLSPSDLTFLRESQQVSATKMKIACIAIRMKMENKTAQFSQLYNLFPFWGYFFYFSNSTWSSWRNYFLFYLYYFFILSKSPGNFRIIKRSWKIETFIHSLQKLWEMRTMIEKLRWRQRGGEQ